MPSVALLAANNSKTAATTLDVTVAAGTTIPAGTLLMLWAAWDNTTTGTTSPAPTGSISDLRGNTYTKRGERGSGSASGSGVVGALFTSTLGTTLQAGDWIRLTLTASVTARSLSVYETQGADFHTGVAVTSANGVSASPSVSITPSANNQIVLGFISREDAVGATFTQDTDTLNGAWNTIAAQGSTGGSAQTNVSTVGAWKQVTVGLVAQSYNPSIASTDWVAIAAIFDPVTIARTPTDSLGLVDNLPAERLLTDTVALDDDVAGSRTADNDGVGLADSASYTLTASGPILTDALGLVDSTAVALARSLPAESLGLTDSAASVYVGAVEATDALAISDPSASNIVATAEFTDPAGLTDGIDAENVATRVITDALGADDDVAGEATIDADRLELLDSATYDLATGASVTVTDALGLTESIITSAAVSLTDSLGIADSSAVSVTTTSTDALGLVDSANASVVVAVGITDSLGIADASVTAAVTERTTGDAMGLVDDTSTGTTSGRVPTDAAGLSDTSTATLIATATATDALGLVDATTSASVTERTLTSSLGLTDLQNVEGTGELVRTIADGLGITGALTGELSGPSDPLGLSDQASYIAGPDPNRSTTDALGLVDTLSVSATTERTVTDTLGVTDAGRSAATDEAVTDAIGVSDGATGALDSSTIARTISDGLGLADEFSRLAAFLSVITDALGVIDAMDGAGFAVTYRRTTTATTRRSASGTIRRATTVTARRSTAGTNRRSTVATQRRG